MWGGPWPLLGALAVFFAFTLALRHTLPAEPRFASGLSHSLNARTDSFKREERRALSLYASVGPWARHGVLAALLLNIGLLVASQMSVGASVYNVIVLSVGGEQLSPPPCLTSRCSTLGSRIWG